VSDSSKQTEFTGPRCGRCGAPLREGVTECWLCHASAPAEGHKAGVTPAPGHARFEPADADDGNLFSRSSLLLFVTLACVVVGVMTIAPGLAIPLAIVAFFAWARTVGEIRSAKNASAQPNTALVFLQSIAFVLTLLTLIAIGTFAAFFVVCLTAVGAMSSGNAVASIAVGLVLLIGVFIALIRTFRRVQHR
jgi:hypothetical protein